MKILFINGSLLFQGVASEKWMLEVGEYTMNHFVGLYGTEYGGRAIYKEKSINMEKAI